jgi:hypothetical protein
MTEEVFLHRFRRGGVEPGGQPEEGAGGAAGRQVPEEADVLQGRVFCTSGKIYSGSLLGLISDPELFITIPGSGKINS